MKVFAGNDNAIGAFLHPLKLARGRLLNVAKLD
jgi:hypothetical protein